jgi:hypothetical protein
MKLALLMATALVAVAPLHAQATDPSVDSPPKTDPAHVAADAAERPVTQSLNNAVDGNIANTQMSNAEAQGQYAADRAAYVAAVRQHNREVRANDRTVVRQQIAYADAMADWRTQVAACQRGHQRACDMPPPDPMNYM